MKLSNNALYILQQRYLLKDKNGELIENPEELFRRVAKTLASIESQYGKSDEEVSKLEEQFYIMMTDFDFLPNSPTLMNAGTNLGQLSACFVIPVEDDIDSIFNAVRYTARIHKSGGGTGFSFSKLRPKYDVVQSTGGIASGPISFMNVFDATTEVIKQGGKRRGANMGILRIDHPDIFDFIVMKETEGKLKNFNISIAVTDEFMEAVKNDTDLFLINPRTGKNGKCVKARALWNLLVLMAWKNGEPGIIFIDMINKYNPTPDIGIIESTNPCGEQPLLPWESCNLGSINLSNFTKSGRMDWLRLREVIRLSVRFLDNVIDSNKLPLKQIDKATKANRKIGLGVMGWADLLLRLGIKYNSDKAFQLAKKVMKFVQDEGRQMSRELGKEKGNFLNKDRSIYKDEEYMRNATITTIAPTGTISLIADCSSGIEPIFSIVVTRNVKESLGKNLVEINPAVKRSLELKGIWGPELEVALKQSSCINCTAIPKEMKEVMVTAREISPEWHVKMQSIFQKYTDNAVSKTCNMPNGSTIDDVEKVFLLAYELGCKGITIYRDGSRKFQVLVAKDTPSSLSCPTCD